MSGNNDTFLNVLNGLKSSIENLNTTIGDIDKLNKTRYEILKADLDRILEKFEGVATEASVAELAKNAASFETSTRKSLDAILEHFRPKPTT